MHNMQNDDFSSISYLFIGKYFALFIGHFFDNIKHKHHAVQFCSNITGDLEASIDNHVIKGEGFLIAPGVPHKLIRGTGKLFLLFFDPESIVGGKIVNKYLKTNRFIYFPSSLFTKTITEPITADIVHSIMEKMLKEVGIIEQKDMDPRIITIIDLLKKNTKKRYKVKDFARAIHLSESRLQHLFKEEIGISIAKYLLWNRIVGAIQSVQNFNDLTSVAHEAGFSDSAHFSRTFKEMYGVCLKELFKTSGNVQVVFLE